MRYFLTALAAAVVTALVVFPLAAAQGVAQAEWSDTSATLLVGYIGAGITISATLIAVWGVYTQRLIMRRQTTVQHLFALKADSSIQANVKCLIEAARGDQNLAKWADKDQIGETTTLAIIAVLNDYELLSTGIQSGIYDYQIAKKYDASTIKRIWKNAHPFVAALRNRTNVPTLWKEFELLHSWIDDSKSPAFTLFLKGLT